MNFKVCALRQFPCYSYLRCSGAVIGGLNTRRGVIIDSEVREDEFTATAEVALNDMFGYSNQLRGSTQGKGICVCQQRFFFFTLGLLQGNLAWSTRWACLFAVGQSLFLTLLPPQNHMPVLPSLQKELEDAYRKTLPQAKK